MRSLSSVRRSLLAALVALVAPASAALAGVGDPAPALDPKEWINIAPPSASELAGKVLYIDIFRTG
jgi:hypothetical protein